MKILHLFFIFLILCSSIILETKQTQASGAIIAAVVASSSAAAYRRQVEQKELEEANKVKAMCMPPYWFGEENNCTINYAQPRDPLNFICTKPGEKYDIVAGCDGSIIKITYHNVNEENRIAEEQAKPFKYALIFIGGFIILMFIVGLIFN